MTIKSDSAERGQKELRTDWPNVEGDTLGTTKIEGRTMNLTPQTASNVRKDFKVGI